MHRLPLGNGRISGIPDIRSGYLGIRHYPDLPDTSVMPDPDPDINEVKNYLYRPRERFANVPI